MRRLRGVAIAAVTIAWSIVTTPSAGAEAKEPTTATSLSGGVTVIGLGAEDDPPESEITASIDFYLDVGAGPGTLLVYVEGSTTPRDRGVSSLVPECNADAATALNRDGEGRLQVSELKYAFTLPGERTLDVGLLDSTAYLDVTRINNDENMQFLGASFLNNPAIEFPDYTLGLVYHRDPVHRGPAVSVVLTGSEGLGDNPDASYAKLFDLSSEGRGVFMGVEAGWQSQAQRYRLGGWFDNSDHPRLADPSADEENYGLYVTVDGRRGPHEGNVRVGTANGSVSLTATFASLTYQFSWSRQVLGLGVARRWSSRHLAEAAPHATSLEAYVRVQITDRVFLTPSVQYARDSAFGVPGSVDSSLVFFALRLHARF